MKSCMACFVLLCCFSLAQSQAPEIYVRYKEINAFINTSKYKIGNRYSYVLGSDESGAERRLEFTLHDKYGGMEFYMFVANRNVLHGYYLGAKKAKFESASTIDPVTDKVTRVDTLRILTPKKTGKWKYTN